MVKSSSYIDVYWKDYFTYNFLTIRELQLNNTIANYCLAILMKSDFVFSFRSLLDKKTFTFFKIWAGFINDKTASFIRYGK